VKAFIAVDAPKNAVANQLKISDALSLDTFIDVITPLL
jgi:hypothetical protein